MLDSHIKRLPRGREVTNITGQLVLGTGKPKGCEGALKAKKAENEDRRAGRWPGREQLGLSGASHTDAPPAPGLLPAPDAVL